MIDVTDTTRPEPRSDQSGPDAIADGARLAALRELGLLDGPSEPDLDRYTTLVSELLSVPVSLLSLVDRERQFFAGSTGLTGVWAEARQTPLSHSLCRRTVVDRAPLIISDARTDPRVAGNLAVRDLGVTAYAGIPLELADGQIVGSLCAIDHRPREWTERELRILADLAAAVRGVLELRRALHRQSLHDSVTGLPNRSLTIAYAEQLLHAHPEEGVAAVAVGIDELDPRVLRSGRGDRVTALVARRLEAQLSGAEVLGRVDEGTFLVLLPDAGDHFAVLRRAHALRGAVCDEPLTVRGDVFEVTAAVGVAGAVCDGDGDGLTGRALESLRQVRGRSEHGDGWDPGAIARAEVRRRLRGRLAGAVRRGEIIVAFQPIVDLSTGEARRYEALARWHHPELGVVGPGEFIPTAEATGDIVLIGERVLREACAQLAAWRGQPGGEQLGVTVNLSPVQLAVPNIREVVSEILRDVGLPGSALTLEITEGVFVDSGAVQLRNLESIRELGVQLALDDFGTGYSTLSYLKRFPVDLLKVDRCFLDGFETDRRDAALLRAILALGAGMDLEVVAEGVETGGQRELLRRSGCPLGQGFLFSEPRLADEIEVDGPAGRRPASTSGAR